jgi:hypothetical protein
MGVMSVRHVVGEDEGIDSIAAAHGWFPDALWEHPDNAELRARRASGQVLLAGDVVHVPPLRTKVVDVAIDQRHRFVRRGVPSRLRVRMIVGGQPLASTPFTLSVDGGAPTTGVTGSGGEVEAWIPPAAKRAVIATELHSLEVHLARLDPIDTPSGLAQRLQNLEYLARGDDPVDPDDLEDALMGFQDDHGLTTSGTADAETLAALVRVHGS